MASVTRRPSQARDRRRGTETQVLEAVEQLLAAGESFTTLPVSRIAAAAGISRSTFYDYFPDKATLIEELTASATEALFAAARAFVSDDTTTRADLDRVVAHHVSEYRRHAPLMAANAEVAAYEPQVAARTVTQIEAFIELCAARLERDQQAGRVRRDLDPRSAAAFVAWGTERSIQMHVARHPESSDAAFAAGLAAATWGAMGRA